MVKRKCPNCKTYTIKLKCDACGIPTVQEKSCPRCGRSLKDNYCGGCKADAVLYQRQPVNFKQMIDNACATPWLFTAQDASWRQRLNQP